jgi:hypothetical protein
MTLKALFTGVLWTAVIVQSVPAAAQTTSSSTFYNFPDRGGFSILSTGGNGPVTVGYATLLPGGGTTAPTAFAIFGFRTNNVLVSEASVPAMIPVLSGRAYAEVNGPINTGIAFANPNTFPVTISFFFTNQSGNSSATASFTLNAGAQVARFLNEAPFNSLIPFTGTFTFTASAPIGVISLRGLTNERGEFLITTQTVASITTTSTGPLVMPHFADGGGWKTQVLLVNPTDSPISGIVQFFGEGSATVAATALVLSVNGHTGSAFSYAIPPHASANLQTSGTAPVIQIGSVLVTPDSGSNAPSAFTVFSFTASGITTTEASVASQPVGVVFRTFVQLNGTVGQAGSINSGIAVTNTSSAATTVNFDLTTLNGTSTGLTTSLTVPALGHISAFLNELFPGLKAPFSGVLRINATITPVAVAGLLTANNDRGEFLIATTPATNELSTTSTAGLVFPHVVNMGGYTTQFVLFSGTQYQSALGTLNFFTQSGQPLNLTFQ